MFAGIQKLTLLDYPDKTACTLFTEGCNFNCPYCQNPSLIPFGKDTSNNGEDSVFEFLNSRKGLLDGVCISGGEPLAHEGIFDFARKVKEMGFLVKIDTNGSYPDRLGRLAESGAIDYVAMDIKNTPEKYPATVGISGYDTVAVMSSIKYLLSGIIPYEFRTTVVRELHHAGDLVEIARLISGTDKYYLQSYVTHPETREKNLNAYSEAEMQEIVREVQAVLPCTRLRGTQ